MPKAKPAPSLLILAEPLLREGLLRLLEIPAPSGRVDAPYTQFNEEENSAGRPQLVIWGPSASMPAASLSAELRQLRERWQPAPLLLLLAGEVPYPSDWLLQLPAEGLLQQAEPAEIRSAVATVLAGGRVLELRPLAASPAGNDAGAIGLGQWLLQSGLAQITAEQRRCRHWLELSPGGLTALLLRGRLRELAVARRLLLWLWGPIAMAFPQPAEPAATTAGPAGLAGTAISLRERTAVGVWEAIQGRLAAAVQQGLNNHSGQLLALEGLSPEHRRDLLLALLSQLDLLITRLRHEQLRGEALELRWQEQQPELRRLSLRRMAGEYVQLPQAGGLLPVAESLSTASTLSASDPDLPQALPMLAALVQAQPLQIAGGQQLRAEQIAPQFRPAAAAGQHLGTDQLGAADQPVADQQFQVQQRLGFIRRQEPALHQQGPGLHQGRQHRQGQGQFGIAARQIAGLAEAVGHRQQASLLGQLHILTRHLPQRQAPQVGLELLPAGL